jgi:hypothetical protein
LEVNILGDLVEQVIENGVGFRFGYTEHATVHARIDMNALPVSYWVDTNNRVYGFNRLGTDVRPTARDPSIKHIFPPSIHRYLES